MPLKTYLFDVADYLTDDEDIEAYLTEVLKYDDPHLFMKALGAVARARGGMPELSRKMGMQIESLQSVLSATGNPELGTALKVMHALGVRLSASLVA